MGSLRRLPRATPESQGMRSAAILEFANRAERELHELHSFMVVRNGYVVGEGWWHPYASELRHLLFSLTKSFTSTAVGMAIDEGCLSLDDPVVSFFPDDLPAEVSPNLAAMQVRHLLSMSTGHDTDSMDPIKTDPDGNWPRAFLAYPVPHRPGTHFLYDTGASHMLSAIVERRTGRKLADYLRPKLFEPLGIDELTWEEDPRGVNTGGYGLSIRTEDIAVFGQTYLQGGQWHGRQVVPHAWVEQATRKLTDNGDDPLNDWNQGYGYQFWMCRHGAYRGDGAFGQYCVVMPGQNAVVAMTSGLSDMQPPLDLVWNVLLPAMAGGPLPDDPAAGAATTERLARLAFDPPAGPATSSPGAAASGRTFRLEPNPLDWQTIRFDFAADGCTITTTDPRGEHSVALGHGVWRRDSTSIVEQAFDSASAGAWASDDRYVATLRAVLTPFVMALEARFDGDAIEVSTRINVSFDPIETIAARGTAV